MASNTPNLGLYKKDPVVDGADTFNIQTMLNDNWDRIDAAVADVAKRTVIAQRERDPTLPSYGMDTSVVLRAAPYTGAAEITLQVEERLYDAENMSARPQEAPNGTIIVRKMED